MHSSKGWHTVAQEQNPTPCLFFCIENDLFFFKPFLTTIGSISLPVLNGNGERAFLPYSWSHEESVHSLIFKHNVGFRVFLVDVLYQVKVTFFAVCWEFSLWVGIGFYQTLFFVSWYGRVIFLLQPGLHNWLSIVEPTLHTWDDKSVGHYIIDITKIH